MEDCILLQCAENSATENEPIKMKKLSLQSTNKTFINFTDMGFHDIL